MSATVNVRPSVSGSSTSLTIYDLPSTANENTVYSLFPTAQHVSIVRNARDTSGFQNVCILQFNTPYECQKVYAECQDGKEVAGRMLHVEFGQNYGYDMPPPAHNYPPQDTRHGNAPSSQDNRRSRPSSTQREHSDNRNSGDNGKNGCTLTVSNLPYTATERDILKEFPEALRVVLDFDDRGRSRGVAKLSFSNQDKCNAALQSCNYKTLSGRPVRGRIIRESSDDRSEYNSGQRSFGDRQNQSRQNDYSDRRDRDSRYTPNRGRGSGNRGNGSGDRGGNRFVQRDFGRDNRTEQFNNRRDRSPARQEPVRGYGNSKGPRITSAVIHRPGGASSSDASSDSD